MPEPDQKKSYGETMDTAGKRFARLLAEAAERAGRKVSYADFARHMGVSRGTVSNWIKKETLDHDRDLCVEIAQVFRQQYAMDVSWQYLYLGQTAIRKVDWQDAKIVNEHIEAACEAEGVTLPVTSQRRNMLWCRLYADYQRDGTLNESDVRELVKMLAGEPEGDN